MPGHLTRFAICIPVLLLAAMPVQAGVPPANVPPANLPDLIASVIPECVNISFMKVEKQPDGELKIVNKGVGSGFVVDADGIIATNHHVTDGGNQFLVTFSDDMQLKATLIYRSPDIDMALLRVFPAKPLQAVTFGDSSVMRQGDQVIAIGNPLALSSTVTTGIISALNRNIGETDLDSFLQFDAAVNPGNSGGPLFNMRGEVIGMNTAFFGGNYSAGLSLAIPGNDVQFVLNSLRAHGRVIKGYLGATLQSVGSALAFAFGLPFAQGAIVVNVPSGTPAAAAGLQPGDILLRMNGMPIRDVQDANRAIAGSEVGEKLPVELRRDGRTMTLPVTLENSSTETETVKMEASPPAAHDITVAELGLDGAALTDELRQKFALKADATGVVLTQVRPGGLGDALGFKVGDLVLRVQDTPVLTIDDIARVAAQAHAEQRSFVAILLAGSKGLQWIGVPFSQ